MTTYQKIGDYEIELDKKRLRKWGLSRYKVRVIYRELRDVCVGNRVAERMLWKEIRKVLGGKI